MSIISAVSVGFMPARWLVEKQEDLWPRRSGPGRSRPGADWHRTGCRPGGRAWAPADRRRPTGSRPPPRADVVSSALHGDSGEPARARIRPANPTTGRRGFTALKARMGADHDVVDDAEIGEDAVVLEGAGEPHPGEPLRAVAGHVLRPSSRTAPASGAVEAGDKVEQRRLTGPIRADDRDELALRRSSRSMPATAVRPPKRRGQAAGFPGRGGI